MHELSIACALVEEAQKIAAQEHSQRILKVVVAVGELSGVDPEALEACFPMAAEGTPADKAELVIERIATIVSCRACGRNSAAQIPFLCCTKCGSGKVEIEQGQELLIKSIEVEG